MAINLGELNDRNKKQQQELYNQHYNNVGGLNLRRKSSLDEERRRREEEERLRKQQEEQNSFFKGGDSNFGVGMAASSGDFLLDVGQGFFRTLEGVSDFLQYSASDSQKKGSKVLESIFGKNAVSDFYGGMSDFFKENAKFDSTGSLFGTNENAQDTLFGNEWRQNIDQSSYLGGMGDQIGEGIGNIGAMAAMSAVGASGLGAAGIGVTEAGTLTTGGKLLLSGGNSYISAYGNARSEAYKNGASDDEANRYAIINGLAEAVSEQFFDSMPGISSAGFAEKIGIKDFLANKIKSGVGSNTAKVFLKLVGGFEEGAEEMISNALVAVGQDIMHSLDENYTYGMDNLTGNVVEDFKNNFVSEDSLKSFISAGFTSVLLGAGGDILTTAQTNQVINAFAKDNNMSFKEAKALLSGENLNQAQQQVQREDNGNISNQVELEDAAKQRIINYMKANKGKGIESRIEALVQNEAQKKGIEYTPQQLKEEADKIRAELIDQTNSPDRYMNFVQTDKETNNELAESFRKAGVNNSKQAHEMYNFVSKLQESNKNLKYEVVNNKILKEMGQSVEGATINGFNQDGTIYINMDAKNPYQAVAYHEIAHSIKDTSPELYNELKNLVFELKGKEGLEQYRKLYKVNDNELASDLTENVEDEFINDQLGEILNDDNFINKIDNRNIIQKLIDEIKRVVKYMTSSKDQKALMKTQQRLEEIYKQGLSEAESKEGTAFSLQEGLEAQGTKIFEQAEADYQAARQNILDYLEENNIENPTKQDMMDAYGWYDEYDATNDLTELQRAERIYNEAADELLKEMGKQPRYSLSVQEADTKTDNTGKELSKGQQEYFKNSKITDENGNLIEVFHTTTEYTHQFNEFNPVGTPLYRYGNTAVNFFTDSQEMSNSYGYNMVTPDTTRIESMEDLSKQLGDRYRVEENNGKYELFDSNDEKQLDSYKDLMKIFNQEEQDILNKTFNKSRSEVRELLNNDEEQFDFYDKTRTKFLNMLSHYNKYKGLDLTGSNMTIDKIVDNYLRNEKLEPITTFNSQEDLFKNAIKYVSPYEHYQYNGYVNITNPYIVDAKGTNWNKIQVENIDELKQQIKDKWDVPERQLDKLEGDTLKELNKDLTKLGYQIRPDDLGDLGIFTNDSQLAIDVINVNDVMQEIREDLDSDLKTPISTNDIVFQALAENEAGANYDGVIIQNVIDYGENSRNPDIPNNVYVTFDSNQFKAADNLNPTSNKDIRYSLSTNEDTELNELSKGQMDYFKNTKAVDKNGYLEIVYHGTPHDFTIFDITKAGETGLVYGNGFYFTNSRGTARGFTEGGMYGDTDEQIKEGYVNIEKPASYDEKTMTYDEFKALYEALNKNPNMYDEEMGMSNIDALLSDYGDIYSDKDSVIRNFYNSYDTDVNLIDNLSYIGNPTEFYKVLRDTTGYDGVIIDNPNSYDSFERYFIAYNPDQFKLASNKNPTSDVDMRFSLARDEQQSQNSLLKVIESYDDYLKTLPSYQRLQERQEGTPLSNYTDESHGILTKEDYKNKKIELFDKQVEKADNKMEEQAKRFARENLELTRKAREQLQTIIDKYKGQSRESIFNSNAKEEIREFVRNNSRQEFVEEIIDEETRDLQKAIRNTELVISKENGGEFADGITAFKKNNPGLKIKYGKQNIDSVYQELQEQFPGMLESDVNDKDIPFILADVLKKSYRHFDNSNVQVFELNDSEIDNIANKIYKGLTNNAISDEQLESLTKEISQKVEDKYARAMATEKYREIARNTIDLTDIKDKKRGIQYKVNTMKRNLRDIMSKEQAQLWYDTYFKPITIHNAQSEIDKQDYVERIQKYNLNNAESTYTQMLGELKYNPETNLTSDQVNTYAETHNVDKQKCTEAVEEFRNIYDELIGRVNEALKANGYKEIDYRKGYFPHFIEDKPNSIIGKFADKFGWNIQKGTLPTDIAGLTDGFKPGKAWTSFSQQRTGDNTDYNALKGMDNYLRGAMDLIYHTEDIQKLRALENEIRYQYSSDGVKAQIDEIYANQELSAEEKAQQIALLTDNVRDNPLGNLVTELRDYTNGLANKKSILDRGMEQALGRDWYS